MHWYATLPLVVKIILWMVAISAGVSALAGVIAVICIIVAAVIAFREGR